MPEMLLGNLKAMLTCTLTLTRVLALALTITLKVLPSNKQVTTGLQQKCNYPTKKLEGK